MSNVAGIPKTHLVVLALYRLGGESDLEKIAVEAWTIFPQQFSWRTYSEYPDKDAVRAHLSEAKKPTFGRLVVDEDLRGKRRGGEAPLKRYGLTSAGVTKAREVQELLGAGMAVTAAKNSVDYHRVVAPIVESDAFRRFKSGVTIQHISRDSFLLGFRLFPDSASFAVERRLGRAASVIDQLPDSQEKSQLQQYIKQGRGFHEL